MSTRLIQLVALILAAAGVLCSFMLTPTINQQRVDRQLTYDLEVGTGANPAYTLGASLGSFRGVLINVLWQRSEQLKQDGKFFESNNLAEYITTLQPRFPDAWDIQAWNMAYNISVKTKTPEERWDWVNKGMVLLRDRSSSIQFEAFHVFKIFVANPHKEGRVRNVLLRNQAKLLDFMSSFQSERADEQFVEEKQFLINEISNLQPAGSEGDETSR